MKICGKCGYRDFKPEEKCPECGDKYDQTYGCNPLSASTRDFINPGGCNGYTAKGDPNSRHNKD